MCQLRNLLFLSRDTKIQTSMNDASSRRYPEILPFELEVTSEFVFCFLFFLEMGEGECLIMVREGRQTTS